MIDDVLNEMMGGGTIERYYDMREAKTMEELLQEPDLSPLAGAHEFYTGREYYEARLNQRVCPMCDADITVIEPRGIWKYAEPCGCRVGYAGKPIPQRILNRWDDELRAGQVSPF